MGLNKKVLDAIIAVTICSLQFNDLHDLDLFGRQMVSERNQIFSRFYSSLIDLWNRSNYRARVSIILFFIAVISLHKIYFDQSSENDKALYDLRRRVKEWKADKFPHPQLVSRHVPRSLFHYHEAIDLINKDDGQKYWLVMHSPYPLMNINYWIYPKEAYVDVDTQILHYNNLLHLSTEFQHPTPPVSGYDKIIQVEQIFAEFVEE